MKILLTGRLEEQIYELIAESLERMGLEVVRVKLSEASNEKTLQIMLDRMDGKQINVDDCERASKHLSALLDVNDPIEEQYHLEVSSPGIDRPLTRFKDFEKYKGHEVKLETKVPVSGQKRFRGKLLGTRGDDRVVLLSNVINMTKEQEETEVEILFTSIEKAKLILTDELLNQHS